jgi:hypothetical protein
MYQPLLDFHPVPGSLFKMEEPWLSRISITYVVSLATTLADW